MISERSLCEMEIDPKIIERNKRKAEWWEKYGKQQALMQANCAGLGYWHSLLGEIGSRFGEG